MQPIKPRCMTLYSKSGTDWKRKSKTFAPLPAWKRLSPSPGSWRKRKNSYPWDIPWTTSCIEQLLGTQPIIYSLEGIHSDQGEAAAADFERYLTVIGGGRMYVDTRVNSPAGKYTVSLRVSNEGFSVVLTDIFTFVLQ